MILCCLYCLVMHCHLTGYLSCEWAATWRSVCQQTARGELRADALASAGYCNEWGRARGWGSQSGNQVMEKEFGARVSMMGGRDGGKGVECLKICLEMQVQWRRKFIGNYEPTATGEWGRKTEVMEGTLLKICIKILFVVGVALRGILLKGLTWA